MFTNMGSRVVTLILFAGAGLCLEAVEVLDPEDAARIGPSEPGFLPAHALRFAEPPEGAVVLPGDSVFFNCRTAGGPVSGERRSFVLLNKFSGEDSPHNSGG